MDDFNKMPKMESWDEQDKQSNQNNEQSPQEAVTIEFVLRYVNALSDHNTQLMNNLSELMKKHIDLVREMQDLKGKENS